LAVPAERISCKEDVKGTVADASRLIDK